MKIQFKQIGRKFLLHWYTYEERGHLLLANSQRSLLNVANSLAQKKPWAELKHYLEIDIVPIPDYMHQLSAQHDRREAINRFKIYLTISLQDLIKAKRNLPRQFYLCDNYDPQDLAPTDISDWARETHYQCGACHEGIIFPSTNERLYDTYSRRWYENSLLGSNNPENKYIEKQTQAIQLPEEDPQLYFAEPRFGHHNDGIDLRKVDIANCDDNWRPAFLASPLFFYKEVARLDIEPIQSLFEDHENKRKTFKNKMEENRKEKYQADEKAKLDAVINFFNV